MLLAYFDGACEPINPGGTCSYGFIIYRDKELLHQGSQIYTPEIPLETSNNIAEYLGFIATISCLKDKLLDHEPCTIHGDSKLVIQQMSGYWRIKSGLYTPFALHAREILSTLHTPPFLQWIPREQNTIADELSKAHLSKLGITPRIWRK